MKEIVGVSTFVGVLVQRLNSFPAEHSASNSILRLLSELKGLDGVIDDAERKGRDSELVNAFLLSLQVVIFRVNDLIDEMELEVQSHQRTQPGGFSFSLSRLNPFSKESRLVPALKHVRKVLYEIVADVPEIQFSLATKLPSVPQGTTSLTSLQFSASDIIGREHDERKIKDAIFNHVAAADSGVLVIGILGMGGIGKTALAQLIYIDPLIRSEFDIMLWVFDARQSSYHILHELRKQVIEQIDLNLGHDMKSSQLEVELSELLHMKRVFLVLDGRWPESSLFTEQVYGLLQNASRGSVLVVTTRWEQVALAIRASVVHELRPLSSEVSYQLFTRHACASNVQFLPEIEIFARKLVERSKGIPLALVMFGQSLRDKDDLHEWREVLEKTDPFDTRQSVLNLISNAVTPHLKLPFCTLGLQQVSSVEELICLWMALGFLYSDDPNQQPEYIGREYLRELSQRSLLGHVEHAPGGVITDFELHDLLSDLANKTAQEQGFRSLRKDESPNSIDNTIKYLILEEDCQADTDLLAKLHATKLQLLVLCPGQQSLAQSLMNILSTFRRLRVLGLGGCDIENLPDSIGQLKHLRYLDFAGNELLSCLPDSICNLWHLQTLLLHGCHQFKKVPTGIGKLQNLRYLTLTTSQITLQEEIGQLTSLRTLGLSSCQHLVSIPRSLKKLNKLETLGIIDCPKVDLLVSSSVEAMSGMVGLDTLLLSGLLEFQQFPPDLGAPSRVMKHLSIQFSMKLLETAWLNQFLFLHSLTIEDCPQLSTLLVGDNSQFNNMAELVIRRCPQLGDTKWIRQFVSLQSLIIDGCPNLGALDAGFTTLGLLEWLEIRRCPVLIERIQILGGVDSSYISHVEKIELDGVPLPRPSQSKNPTQEDEPTRSSVMDAASSSNHVISKRFSASEISEDAS